MARMPSAALMKSLWEGPSGLRSLTFFSKEGGGCGLSPWRENQTRRRNLSSGIPTRCSARAVLPLLPANYFAPPRKFGQQSPARLTTSTTPISAGDSRRARRPTMEPYRVPKARPPPPPPPPPAPAVAAAPPVPEEQVTIGEKEMEELLAVAVKVADAAGDIIRQLFRTKMDVSAMQDESPASVAEGTAEYAMSVLISQHFPAHAMYAEESGLQMPGDDAEFIWVMDPIYGADSFMSGKPLFGVLISLVYKGVPVLGIIDQPILRERWIGRLGKETTLNGEVVTSRSSTQALKDAYMFATSPHLFTGSKLEMFNHLRDKVKVPQYGGDCYAYGLLAAGHVDLVVESGLRPYDFLALIPVIEGAGGLITDWQGRKLKFSPKSVDNNAGVTEVVAAGSVAVHKAALAALADGKKK